VFREAAGQQVTDQLPQPEEGDKKH